MPSPEFINPDELRISGYANSPEYHGEIELLFRSNTAHEGSLVIEYEAQGIRMDFDVQATAAIRLVLARI